VHHRSWQKKKNHMSHSPVTEINDRTTKPAESRDNGAERISRLPLTGESAPISAGLTGVNRCEALGVIATGYSPVLVLCRELLAAGVSPDRALDVYRAGVLALRIRAIGEAARLTVEDDKNGGPKFRVARPQRDGAASLVRFQPKFDPAVPR